MSDRDALAREMWFNVWPADEDAKDYNWRYAVEHNLTDAVFVCADIAMRHIEAARAEERARCADIAETMRLDCMANGVRDVCTTAMVGTAATLRDAIRAGSPAPATPVVWTDEQVERARLYLHGRYKLVLAPKVMRAALEAASREAK